MLSRQADVTRQQAAIQALHEVGLSHAWFKQNVCMEANAQIANVTQRRPTAITTQTVHALMQAFAVRMPNLHEATSCKLCKKIYSVYLHFTALQQL